MTAEFLEAIAYAERSGKHIAQIDIAQEHADALLEALDTIPGYNVIRNADGVPVAAMGTSPVLVREFGTKLIKFTIVCQSQDELTLICSDKLATIEYVFPMKRVDPF